MKEKIEQLKALNHKAELGGGEDRIAKQHAAGKLTARERIELLLEKVVSWKSTSSWHIRAMSSV